MKHWISPRYWRWLWHHRIGRGAKAFLVTMIALLAATGGYASARTLVPEEDSDVFVERVVTLVHKEQVPGSERVVTVRQTVTTREPQKTKVVTVNGRTITVRAPTQTIAGPTVTTRGKTKIVKLPGKTKYRTIKVAGQTRTIVDKRTDTVVRTETLERSSTVTSPGVTLPGRTETIEREGPSRTVTNDRTVTNERTVTGPTNTVTGPTVTVTGPTQTTTVTGPTQTATVTVPPKTVTETDTVTHTVTVTQPPPPGTNP